MRITLVFIFLCSIANLFAQVRIGDWQSHLPYQAGRHVTQSPDKIIYATEWAIISIDKEDFSPTFLSKVEGLSDIGVSQINYDYDTEQLVIAYNNGNIDLVQEGTITNLPNIRSNQAISGDKRINGIYISESLAYFSTGFGVVELNLRNTNFGFTVFTNVKVNDVVVKDDYIYMATDDGVFQGNRNSGINLGDFNNWSLLGEDSGLPEIYEAHSLAIFKDKIYAGIGNELWKEQDGLFKKIHSVVDTDFNIELLHASESNLMLGLKDNAFSSKVLFFDAADNFTESLRLCTDRLQGVVEDEKNRIWYADEWNQLRYSNSKLDECQRLEFNSPFSHKASNIAIKESSVYIASGGVSENFGMQADREGIYVLSDNIWTNINESFLPAIRENDLLNFFQVVAHPSQNKIYAGTFWGGLMELERETNSVKVFNKENSSLQGTIGDEARERIAGLVFDDKENLWVSNMWAPQPLSVYTAEGVWQSFDIDLTDKALTDIAIDFNGYKWIVVFGNQGGLLIYDDFESIADPSDDFQVFLNKSNSELTTNSVNAIAVDLEGSVWVGTAEGPVIFECGSEIFDEECEGRRIKVQQDSIGAFLLADVEIRTIAIDGGNRKWFGTRNGIFVQSPDGRNEELRFTQSNSPLFDDNIIDLEFDKDSGVMYIATNKGVQSYKTATTGGTFLHRKSNVYAYPNPVRPEYVGPIAVKGLAQDAIVKITDVNGKLVYETEALGGTAIWEGTDLAGNKVATGVYLVFSTSTSSFDNPDSFVTKILFIN